jgi:hypothetical protein
VTEAHQAEGVILVFRTYAILGWDQTKANGFTDSEVTFADSQVS